MFNKRCFNFKDNFQFDFSFFFYVILFPGCIFIFCFVIIQSFIFNNFLFMYIVCLLKRGLLTFRAVAMKTGGKLLFTYFQHCFSERVEWAVKMSKFFGNSDSDSSSESESSSDEEVGI